MKKSSPLLWLAGLAIVIAIALSGYWVGKQFRSSSTANSVSSASSSNNSSTSNLSLSSVAPAPSGVLFGVVLPRETSGKVVFESVKRLSPSKPGVKTVLDAITSGPVGDVELSQGFYAPYALVGESKCGGADYEVGGDVSTASIKFCKSIAEGTPSSDTGVAGSGLRAAGRALQSIVDSLKLQGFQNVSVRDVNGNCYAADSGVTQACVVP